MKLVCSLPTGLSAAAQTQQGAALDVAEGLWQAAGMAFARARLALVAADAITCLGAYRSRSLLRGPSAATALATFQGWSGRTCRALGVRVRSVGEVPSTPCVYVANHRSYLDVPVLSSVLPATFLSNDDVAAWPIVGAAARELGVVFVDRAAMHERIRAARQIARCLRTSSIVVFPEGTTGGGRLPRPFETGLFRLLQRLDKPAVPVTLRYSSPRAYWVEDIGLGDHLRRHVLAPDGIAVDVHIGAPIAAPPAGDGADLGSRVYAAVCAPIETNGELARP